MIRRALASRSGQLGAILLLAAGLLQAIAGNGLGETAGDKLAYRDLGALTVALALAAGYAATRQRDSTLSTLTRAAHASVMAGAGLLCLTTVGRLAWLPALLLTLAGVLTIDHWRDTLTALWAEWNRVLLTALALCELLLAAAGPWPLALVAAIGATALIAAAWSRIRPRSQIAGLLALGTLPLAALGWTALAPLLLTLTAWLVAIPLLRPPVTSTHHVAPNS